jgi:hypothetical protein
MELTELIEHPERLDRETLFELRSMVALYPYFQTARLLLLQNLYLLHDPTFDEELRRAAIYITDRSVLFQMVEAAHYKLKTPKKDEKKETKETDNRTIDLIDNFLSTLPKDEQKKKKPSATLPRQTQPLTMWHTLWNVRAMPTRQKKCHN